MSEPMPVPNQQPIFTQGLEVSDFSGGKTDNYLAARPNQFQDADNFLFKRYGNKAKLVTRPGSRIYDEDYYRIPANDRVAALMVAEGVLFEAHGRNIYTINSGWTTITGPTSNPALQAGSSSSHLSWSNWNKHLLVTTDALSRPMKVFNDGSHRVRNLGLPAVVTGGISLSLSAGASSLSYVYAFIRSDTYTIGTVTFREVSAVAYKTLSGTGTAIGGGNPASISSIPVLANSSTGNYNTTGSKVEIYRTVNNGTAFYYVGEVTNGTTTYSDTTTDATLITNTSLYTEGGIVDFQEPYECKYLVSVNDITWFLHTKEGSATYPNRIRQSVAGAPYASPEAFYDDLDDEIVGASSIGIYPLVFCKNRVYRIEGAFDEFGGGGFVRRELQNGAGCVAHNSIVQTRDGVFWAGPHGFMWTPDGFNVYRISGEFPESYADLVTTTTQQSRIYGVYDPVDDRVFWAAQRAVGSNDNDIIFVLDLSIKDLVRSPDLSFTTLSGGNDTDNFAPSSLAFFGGQIVMGERRGYLLKFSDLYTSDPKISTSTTPDNWTTETIIYDYRGPAFDFGTTEMKKWVPRICVNADNVSNASLGVFSMNDNSGAYKELAEVKLTSNYLWGDETATWGDDIRWNYVPTISHWRRMPARGLRCMLKQVRFTNSLTQIDSSSTLGTATTVDATGTVTLDDNTKKWLPTVVGYYMTFAADNYTEQFPITTRNSDTVLTVTNSNGTLGDVSGSAWKMVGYKKNDVINLLSYVLEWAPLSMSQTPYRAS